jgi:hypothetical protein
MRMFVGIHHLKIASITSNLVFTRTNWYLDARVELLKIYYVSRNEGEVIHSRRE